MTIHTFAFGVAEFLVVETLAIKFETIGFSAGAGNGAYFPCFWYGEGIT